MVLKLRPLAEVPEIVKKELKIVFAEYASDVLNVALECPVKPIEIPNACGVHKSKQIDA